MNLLLRLFLMLLAAATTIASSDVAHAQQTNVPVRVKLNKPLVLALVQPLDFGTVILSGAAGNETYTISQAGIVTCAAGATCLGTPQAAMYNVSGSHRQVVTITVPDFDMVNAGGDAIRFIPDAPTSVTLPNSGNKGTDFSIGGSISVPSDAQGAYVGTMQVTAEYQ